MLLRAELFKSYSNADLHSGSGWRGGERTKSIAITAENPANEQQPLKQERRFKMAAGTGPGISRNEVVEVAAHGKPHFPV